MDIETIIKEVEQIPGWFYPDQMQFLYRFAQKARYIFEIGTYAGKSTLFWALCNPNANIITTDTCIGVPSNGIPGVAIIPEVISRGNIIALHDDSHELVKRYHHPIDLLFIDGSHEYADVCRDILDWLPKLNKDGVIVCHDYMDAWPGIKQAIDNTLRPRVALISDLNGMYVGGNW